MICIYISINNYLRSLLEGYSGEARTSGRNTRLIEQLATTPQHVTLDSSTHTLATGTVGGLRDSLRLKDRTQSWSNRPPSTQKGSPEKSSEVETARVMMLTVPAIGSGNIMRIHAKLNGIDIECVVDSASGGTVVGKNWLKKAKEAGLELQYQDCKVGRRVELEGAKEGVGIKVDGVVKGELQIGSHLISLWMIASSEVPVDLIMSYDLSIALRMETRIIDDRVRLDFNAIDEKCWTLDGANTPMSRSVSRAISETRRLFIIIGEGDKNSGSAAQRTSSAVAQSVAGNGAQRTSSAEAQSVAEGAQRTSSAAAQSDVHGRKRRRAERDAGAAAAECGGGVTLVVKSNRVAIPTTERNISRAQGVPQPLYITPTPMTVASENRSNHLSSSEKPIMSLARGQRERPGSSASRKEATPGNGSFSACGLPSMNGPDGVGDGIALLGTGVVSEVVPAQQVGRVLSAAEVIRPVTADRVVLLPCCGLEGIEPMDPRGFIYKGEKRIGTVASLSQSAPVMHGSLRPTPAEPWTARPAPRAQPSAREERRAPQSAPVEPRAVHSAPVELKAMTVNRETLATRSKRGLDPIESKSGGRVHNNNNINTREPPNRHSVRYELLPAGISCLQKSNMRGQILVMYGKGVSNRIERLKALGKGCIALLPWKPQESYLMTAMDRTVGIPRLLPSSVVSSYELSDDGVKTRSLAKKPHWIAIPIGTEPEAKLWRKDLLRARGGPEAVKTLILTHMSLEVDDEEEAIGVLAKRYFAFAKSDSEHKWEGRPEETTDEEEARMDRISVPAVKDEKLKSQIPTTEAEMLKLLKRGALTPRQLHELASVVWENREVLERVIPETVKGVVHNIELKHGDPIYVSGSRPQDSIKRAFIEQSIEDLLAGGYIEECTSKYSAMASAVPKRGPDGKMSKLRLVIDYRRLNKATVTESYQMPKAEECLRMRKAKIFTKIDLRSGFWQIPVRKADRHKTAFCVGTKMYQWCVMPMGLKNAPACFQKMIDKMLTGIKGEFTYGYADDIIVFSNSWDEHMKHVTEVLRRIRNQGLRVNVEKCEWAVPEVKYLGHIIRCNELCVDPDKTEAIRNIAYPLDDGRGKGVKMIQSFLGMTGYYRRFVRRYAELALPLTELTKKKVRWTFGTNQQRAWDLLKEALITEPVLIQPDFDKEFYLDTDASKEGLGACLAQIGEDGEFHPVAFVSRKLHKPELNFAPRELEALGIVWAVEKLEEFLYGRFFTVVTDHSSLVWMSEGEGFKSRIDKWARVLDQFRFEIKFRAGKENVVADALSRLPKKPDPLCRTAMIQRLTCMKLIASESTSELRDLVIIKPLSVKTAIPYEAKTRSQKRQAAKEASSKDSKAALPLKGKAPAKDASSKDVKGTSPPAGKATAKVATKDAVEVSTPPEAKASGKAIAKDAASVLTPPELATPVSEVKLAEATEAKKDDGSGLDSKHHKGAEEVDIKAALHSLEKDELERKRSEPMAKSPSPVAPLSAAPDAKIEVKVDHKLPAVDAKGEGRATVALTEDKLAEASLPEGRIEHTEEPPEPASLPSDDGRIIQSPATGTANSVGGLASLDTCNNWSSAGSTMMGTIGTWGGGGLGYLYSNENPCSAVSRLYCIGH